MTNRPEHVKELMDDLRSSLEMVDAQWFKATDPREIRSLAMLNDEYEKLAGEGDERVRDTFAQSFLGGRLRPGTSSTSGNG